MPKWGNVAQMQIFFFIFFKVMHKTYDITNLVTSPMDNICGCIHGTRYKLISHQM